MTIRSDMTLPEFLRRPGKQLFIDGTWRPASGGETMETVNPATGQALATLARGDIEDVNEAVAAARRAFEGPWARFTPLERQALLIRIRDIIDANWDELALLESLDMGAPLARTKGLKAYTLQCIMFFASQALNCLGQTIPSSLGAGFTSLTLKSPVGVVGGIIPWNGPLISQWWVLGGALATGCTVVMKPAEDASLTTLRTAELLSDAGVPPGVVNVVTGLGREAGSALAEHRDVDRIAFTGSTATGREIIRASATNMKRLQLELGGKSPDIICADADLDAAVPGAAMGVFSNSGQVCYAGTRLLVQRSIQDEFVEKLAAFTRGLRLGDPLDMATQLGPIVSARQLDTVLNYISIGRDEGADLVAGGGRVGGEIADGYFVEPTIFANVSNTMRIAREEIFGPVVSVIPFDDIDHAVALANDTDYGLGSAVWTRDIGTVTRMMRDIRAGTLWINCYGAVDPTVGFGGYKQSGYGWKGGPQHIEGFLYQKSVYIAGT